MITRRLELLVLVGAAVGIAPSASAAGLPIGERIRGTVVSVDGPRDLTIRRSGQIHRVRIDNIDAPLGATRNRRAECGAAAATAALRRLAPRGRRLSVFRYGLVEGGRALVDAQKLIGTRHADEWFSDTLVERGYARPGTRQLIGARVIPNTDLVELEYAPMAESLAYMGEIAVDAARARRGVWGACRGRFHLPARRAGPRVRPALWEVSSDGRTTSVGGLELFPSAARPAAKTTFADVAKVFPDLELVRSYSGLCVGTSGGRGLRFQGHDEDDPGGPKRPLPCAVQAVRSITSLDASGTTQGPAVGQAASALASSFPSVAVDAGGRYAELDGADLFADEDGTDLSPPTTWRTAALLHRGRVTALFTRLPYPN